jgi:hypothetical protein
VLAIVWSLMRPNQMSFSGPASSDLWSPIFAENTRSDRRRGVDERDRDVAIPLGAPADKWQGGQDPFGVGKVSPAGWVIVVCCSWAGLLPGQGPGPGRSRRPPGAASFQPTRTGLSEKTIRRRIADGTLTGRRFGNRVIRVDINDSTTWAPSSRQQAEVTSLSGVGLPAWPASRSSAEPKSPSRYGDAEQHPGVYPRTARDRMKRARPPGATSG